MGKKVITVLGATGSQGGGLVRAILNDKNTEFAVRAVTRDVESDKAKELAKLGAEVVRADLDDVDSVKKAFEGAYGVFAVTFFWNHFSPEKELAHAKTIAEVAKEKGVEHLIWSTLEDTRKWVPLSDDRMPTLMEKYKVPHFDAKGEADRHFINQGVQTTFLLASFYWDNFIHFGLGPKRGEDGKLVLTLPMGDKKLAGIVAEDIGKSAYGVFKKGPSETAGRFIGISGDHLTGEELATSLGRALGEEVVYNAVTPATFRSFGFPGADDLGNMFQFYQEFEQPFLAIRNIEETRELNVDLLGFDSWLEKNKGSIPTE